MTFEAPTKVERGTPWDPLHVAFCAYFAGLGCGGLVVGIIKLVTR